MTEPEEPDIKTQLRAQTLTRGLVEGKTYQQIADDLGVTRSHLYALVRNKPEYRTLIMAELELLEEEQQTLIKELENSPSPQDKRTAVVERGKNIRHIRDKILPTLSQNLNVNINTDLDKLNTELYLHNQTLSRLPRESLNLYWTTYNKLLQEQKQK